MTTMDCTSCRNTLPEALGEAGKVSSEAAAHLAGCEICSEELREFRRTWALMDAWTAPEPSTYFDARLRARLLEAQNAAPAGVWERLTSYLQFSTGRGLRPAMAAILAVILVLGGGTAFTLLSHPGRSASPSSPTVNDLRIYDNNAQAVQQMDLLDEPGTAGDGSGQS